MNRSCLLYCYLVTPSPCQEFPCPFPQSFSPPSGVCIASVRTQSAAEILLCQNSIGRSVTVQEDTTHDDSHFHALWQRTVMVCFS